jgi:hypothetical protein
MRFVMATEPRIPGVTIDAASVGEFMDGIFGQAKSGKSEAKRGLERAVAVGLVYTAYKHISSKRARR